MLIGIYSHGLLVWENLNTERHRECVCGMAQLLSQV